MSLVNKAITFKILKMLTTPWKRTKAYKHGIIDREGNLIKDVDTLDRKEKKAYTLLHKLVFNLKRMLDKVPFGKTNFGSYAAALALLKENFDIPDEDIAFLNEHVERVHNHMLNEITNTASGPNIAGKDMPFFNPTPHDEFMGCAVFDVSPEDYAYNMREKRKWGHWKKHITPEGIKGCPELIKYAQKYPKKGIIIRHRDNKGMRYVRYPKIRNNKNE